MRHQLLRRRHFSKQPSANCVKPTEGKSGVIHGGDPLDWHGTSSGRSWRPYGKSATGRQGLDRESRLDRESLRNDFVDWDDWVNLVDNPYYRGLDMTTLAWMFTNSRMGHYIPL